MTATADPFTVAAEHLPTNGHHADPEPDPAEYMTITHAAFRLGVVDQYDDIGRTLAPGAYKDLRKWWRQHGVEQPQTWADDGILPVTLIADGLDEVPTRYEVAEDAADRGDDDPHETAARLKSERAARRRERAEERAESTEMNGAPRSLADRVLTVSGLAQLPPPTPMVDGLLFRGTLAQLAGNPGDGKTFAALGMSCAVATGRRWNGSQVPEALPVVYVAAEGSTGLYGRVAAWCDVNGVPMADLEGHLHVLAEPVQLGDAGQVRELGRIVRNTGAGLVVLDTRARCTVGMEENSATEQGVAVAAAERIVAATGATVLVVHHLGSQSNRGRGSTAWDGAVYSDLVLSRTRGGDVELRCKKHKDAPDGCTHTYRLQPHTVGLDMMPDTEERRRSSLVLVSLDPLTEETDQTAADVLALIRETAGPEGLTRPQITKFAEERDICKQSKVYAVVAALTTTGQLVDVGTKARPKYTVPAAV